MLRSWWRFSIKVELGTTTSIASIEGAKKYNTFDSISFSLLLILAPNEHSEVSDIQSLSHIEQILLSEYHIEGEDVTEMSSLFSLIRQC